jgi:AcrR family transcriptional regulator
VRKETDVPIEELSREEMNGRRILASARQLFVEHGGPDGVNMHQIAKAAEVGQATLYRRYAVMGDICIDIVKTESRPFIDELDTYLGENQGIPSLDKLDYTIARFVSFLEKKMPWLCAVSRAATDYRPLQSPLYQWMRGTCRTLYDEAAQRKEITDIDVPYTVEVLLSALHDIDFHLRAHAVSRKRIVKGLHQIFIERLKRQDES